MDSEKVTETAENQATLTKQRESKVQISVDYACSSLQGHGEAASNAYDRRAAYKDDQWENAEFVDKGEKYESFVDSLVISILTITAVANSAYAIIAPFLPFEFKRKSID